MRRQSMAERLKKSGTATVERLEEARKRLKEHSGGQSKEQSDGQSLEHTNGHSGGQSDTLADSVADTLADSVADTQEDTLKDSQRGTPKNSQKDTLADSPGSNPYFWMTPNQQAVLYFLSTIHEGKTRLADICNGSGVPYGTVRKSLVALERNACITKPKKMRIGQWQGLHIELLQAGKNWIALTGTLKDTLADTHSNTLTRGHSGGHSLISSSSSLNKTTTTQNCESNAEKIISEIMSTDPEYKYWNEQHVSSKQVAGWKNEFGLDLQTILNNLCYARWQILNQKQAINKSPANYIYGIMKKNGGTVNKPAGYKNMAQLDLEFYENWRKERQEHQQKIEQIKADAIQAEIEPKITAILETLDIENKDLQAAIKKIHSDKRQNLIQNKIKNDKPLSDSERSVVKGYLEQILKEKAITEFKF